MRGGGVDVRGKGWGGWWRRGNQVADNTMKRVGCRTWLRAIGRRMARQRGGGRQCMCAGGWQLLVAAGGGALKTSLKLYLKIVPQIVQKSPRKIRFSKEVFARFEVRFDVQQIILQIVPVFVCDRTGLRVNLLLKENSNVSYIILNWSLVLELKFYKLWMFWYVFCLVALLTGHYYIIFFTN